MTKRVELIRRFCNVRENFGQKLLKSKTLYEVRSCVRGNALSNVIFFFAFTDIGIDKFTDP